MACVRRGNSEDVSDSHIIICEIVSSALSLDCFCRLILLHLLEQFDGNIEAMLYGDD